MLSACALLAVTVDRLLPRSQRSQAEIFRQRRKIFRRRASTARRPSSIPTRFRSTPVSPRRTTSSARPISNSATRRPRLPGTESHRRARSRQLSRPHRSRQPACSLRAIRTAPCGRTISSRRRPTSTFSATKQPNTPETHEAWANYDAAQNNIGGRHAGDAAGHRTPTPTAPSPICCWRSFNSAPTLPDQAEEQFQKSHRSRSQGHERATGSGRLLPVAQPSCPRPNSSSSTPSTVDPKNPAPRAALVRLLMQEGKKDEIESFLRQTKKDLPDNPGRLSHARGLITAAVGISIKPPPSTLRSTAIIPKILRLRRTTSSS